MAPRLKSIQADPEHAAREAGLTYVSDVVPGIRRKRAGKSFSYTAPDGTRIRDDEVVARIRKLAIPPAWKDVWICPSPRGHLQATGRDARGRKQYRYHARWREVRDENKYGRMVAFARALPGIRERVNADMGLPGLPCEKVLASVVRLLETTFIRVGNEEYARDNNSFGLTTLRDRHAEIRGAEIRFVFRGKVGKKHSITVTDRRLARVVKRCRDIPGQDLFQYIGDDGERRAISSGDVNAYLKEVSGEDFTAKDFRTWAGTVLAALALSEFETFDSDAQAKTNIVRAIENVAERLGNTPAVCRKCYIHPEIIESYVGGDLLKVLRKRTVDELRDNLSGLSPEEAAVLALLQRRLAQANGETKRVA